MGSQTSHPVLCGMDGREHAGIPQFRQPIGKIIHENPPNGGTTPGGSHESVSESGERGG